MIFLFVYSLLLRFMDPAEYILSGRIQIGITEEVIFVKDKGRE